jgi:hypothetical protein
MQRRKSQQIIRTFIVSLSDCDLLAELWGIQESQMVSQDALHGEEKRHDGVHAPRRNQAMP